MQMRNVAKAIPVRNRSVYEGFLILLLEDQACAV